jgi:antitoxin component YwqK of YwqJK toxin-antitoxin module
MKTIILFTLLFLSTSFTEKEYLKNHYPNGKIREEGWIVDGKKNEYWFYYYENGVKKEEGHKNNVLNGLTLIYKNGEIAFAEKYRRGEKIKSWNTLSEFKKDNN